MDGDELVSAWARLPLGEMGFQPPPSLTGLRTLPRSDGWTILAWARDAPDDQMVAWFREHGEFHRSSVDRDRDHLLILETAQLPPAWRWMVSDLAFPHLLLHPEGTVDVRLVGPREHVRVFLDRHGVDEAEIARASPRDRFGGLLTDRQHEALTWALSAGYYEVPRRTRLQDLAEEMGLSIAALSELLRRAERRVLEAYIQATPSPGQRLDLTDGPWPQQPTSVEHRSA